MARNYEDWLQAFVNYASYSEAPRFTHFWAGVFAISGVLRRHVWVDMGYFKWYPNFFIILVAPPGVVTKSTTIDIGSNLLRRVPGVHFGPNSVTWQSLVTSFAASSEFFPFNGEQVPMSALSLASRELGSLINPRDNDVINLFIELWDGAKTYEKQTKMSGNDLIECPWISMFGATTPSWIVNNVPATMIGGGFFSRCITLYAEEKEKFVAYPKRNIPLGMEETERRLTEDLEHISNSLIGEYVLTEEAYNWGTEWYVDLWKTAKEQYSSDQIQGYLARKQTHVHKLAMILAASRGDSLIITAEHLQIANAMMTDIEADMEKVFAKIGRTETSVQAEKLLTLIGKNGGISYEQAYRHVHIFFPTFNDFEGVLTGLIRSGQVEMIQTGTTLTLRAKHNGVMGG